MPNTRPGRRCARLVLGLLRDGRTVPDGWDQAERRAVTRLHSWAWQGRPAPLIEPAEPVARVEVTEDEHGIKLDGTLLDRPPLSDGYLADAELWGTDDQLDEVARSAGHGVRPPREVVALMRCDRVLGNEGALSARGVGRLRGIVGGALRDWHRRQQAIADNLGMPLAPHTPPRVGPGAVLFVVGPDREYVITGLATNADDTAELRLHPHPLNVPGYPIGRDERPDLRVVANPDGVARGEQPIDLDETLVRITEVRGYDESTPLPGYPRSADEPATPTCDEPGHDHSTSACLGPLPPHAEAVRRQLGLTRSQVVEVTHDPCEAQADALRAEVARLTALLDDAEREADRADAATHRATVAEAALRDERERLAGMRAHADDLDAARGAALRDADELRARAVEAEREVRDLREQRDRLTDEVHLAQGRAERAGQYRAERDDARAQLVEAQRTLAERPEYDARLVDDRSASDLRAVGLDPTKLTELRAAGAVVVPMGIAGRWGHHPPQQLDVRGPGLVTCDGRQLTVEYHPATAEQATTDQTGRPLPALPTRPGPLDDDPRRPHLAHFPDDAVVLTYRELRRLVALHLDHADTSPALPATLARAMRDDGAPLRLAEVLDQ